MDLEGQTLLLIEVRSEFGLGSGVKDEEREIPNKLISKRLICSLERFCGK